MLPRNPSHALAFQRSPFDSWSDSFSDPSSNLMSGMFNTKHDDADAIAAASGSSWQAKLRNGLKRTRKVLATPVSE